MALTPSFSATARDPALRRVALAFVAFNVAEWATWVAMLVYAYGHGGAVASSAVAVIQLVPAALFAPVGATLADRFPRLRILTLAYVAQCGAMAATAVALALGAPTAVVYALAAVAATTITLTRPAQNGLLPTLAHDPAQLARVNAALSAIENASIVAGPALAGLMLAAADAAFVFVVMAAALAVGAVLVAGIRASEDRPAGQVAHDQGAALLLLVATPGTMLLIALLALQQLQVGALDVLFVSLALDALDIGEAGVGFLTAAVGLGGVIGAVAAGAFTPRGPLPRWIVLGALVWGAGLMLVAPVKDVLVVFALVIAAGAGRGLMDVAGRTLLQRTAAPEILSRAFGVLEGLTMAALAIGAALAAFLVARFGPAGAIAATGALLPLVLVVTARSLLAARPPRGAVDLTSAEVARARRI